MRDIPPTIRPTAVTVIAALHFVGAASLLYTWIHVLGIGPKNVSGNLTALYNLLIFGLPVFIGVSLILGIGLLYLQNWARVTAIVLYLLGIAASVVVLALTYPSDLSGSLSPFVSIGLSVTFAIILSSPEVARVFK
jgi:hypothetical protein